MIIREFDKMTLNYHSNIIIAKVISHRKGGQLILAL